MKVCLDLSPNEMMDRHGGFGRYGFYLLEHLYQLSDELRGDVELYALPQTGRPPVPAAEALERRVLQQPMVVPWRHRMQRRLLIGPHLRAAGIQLFHSLHAGNLPVLPGCPVVATVHDMIPVVCPRPVAAPLWPLKRGFVWAVQWIRNHRPDHLICVSETTQSDVMRVSGLSPERITVIHLGVDAARFNTDASLDEDRTLRARHGLPERYFIYVGSDHYRKNHRRLLSAWCRASSAVPEGLVFVGRALYNETLKGIEAEVRRLGLTGRFRWLQGIRDEELPSLYRGATALFAPSLYEGFGLTLLEAMACETPVAAARAGSQPEVAGDAALYFDPLDVDEMTTLMRRISGDDALRSDLRQRGLERAGCFSWPKTARATMALYRRLLAAHRRRSST
jgi:glycosyltransferase involved in cell wall biosynthesis